MMGSTGGGMAPGAGATTMPPEQRFAEQLEQLANMGFMDRQANIQGEMWRYACLHRIKKVFHK